MNRFIFLFLFCVVISFSARTQEITKTGEKYIADLASVEMLGRGYISGGMQRAAMYMASEFELCGLKRFKRKWLQEFTHDVNTFPDSMRVTLDGKHLKPGTDFIVMPGSGNAEGLFEVVELNEKTVWNYYPKNKKAVLFYKPGYESKNTDTIKLLYSALFIFSMRQPVIQVTQNKLTWGVCSKASDTSAFAFIQMDTAAAKKTPKLISLHIRNKFLRGFKAHNVIGYLPATKKSKDYVVICAHYDHLGKMGSNAIFRGANDNAGGCAMLLCMAQELKKRKERNVNYVFIAFASEEAGLLGSTHFTENPLFKLERIKFLINLDLVATGEDGITVVNATEFKDEFERLSRINSTNDYFTQIKKRGPAANSDHYPFFKKGVPSFFIYTMGGSKAYHDIYDVPENLHLEGFEKLVKMLLTFCDEMK